MEKKAPKNTEKNTKKKPIKFTLTRNILTEKIIFPQIQNNFSLPANSEIGFYNDNIIVYNYPKKKLGRYIGNGRHQWDYKYYVWVFVMYSEESDFDWLYDNLGKIIFKGNMIFNYHDLPYKHSPSRLDCGIDYLFEYNDYFNKKEDMDEFYRILRKRSKILTELIKLPTYKIDEWNILLLRL